MRPTAASIIGVALIALAARHGGAQSQPYSGHGAESVTRETIARFAPPPVPADIGRRVQATLDLRPPSLGLPSPDGRRLYFTWAITGTPAAWRLDGAKRFPIQLTAGDDPTRVVGVTPDGKWLALSRDRGGQEDPGLYLQKVDGGPLREIQHVPHARAFYGFTTTDARWVFFTANDQQPDSYAVYRYDLASGEREALVTTPGLWSVADWREAEGQVILLLAKSTGALSREYYEWRQGAPLTPLLGVGEKVEYDAQYGPADGELLVLTNKVGNFRRLYRYIGGRLTPITPDVQMDVASFLIDRPRARLYYVVNEAGYTHLKVVDARSLSALPFPEITGVEQISLGGSSPDGRFVSVGVESARAPLSTYVFDWQTATLSQWVVPSAPEADVSRFAVPRLETYPARDGTAIPAFVRYPPACAPDAPALATPCPVVVEFHGGPEGQAQPGFDPSGQLLVDAGFVLVEPNVRGSNGYGRAWLDADNGAHRLDILTDIEDAGRHYRRAFTRNGQAPKVGILGGSYGGYSALIGMTMFAGTYDAGVSVVGISNLLTFLQNTAPYRRALRASEYGDPVKDADALRRLSPVSYLDKVSGPLLLVQGVDDPRVPVGEAIQMYEALHARGATVELILLEGEGHGAIRRAGRAVSLGHTLRFFEQYLRNAPSGATR